MKNIPVLLFVAFAVAGLGAKAQQFDYTPGSQWSDKPVLHKLSGKFDSAGAVGILDNRRVEYVVDKKDNYIRYTLHKIIRINDDKGIEMFNKIYVPVYRNSEITELKARTIQRNGKVVELPAAKIKEIEEDGRVYKLFAMEGVEKGSEVEYTYTMQRPLSAFGTEVFQSSNVPYERASFTLVSPEHLKFDTRGYNGFAVSSDSVIDGKRIVSGYSENITALEDEKYAVTNPHLQRVQYKLSYNLATTDVTRMYTWKEYAKRIFTAYTTFESKEEKALEKLAGQLDLSGAGTEAEKILLVEDFVKTNFNIDEKVIGEDAEALDKVVKTRNTNRDGSIRIFTYLFDRFGIGYQIVFPSDRNDFPIEEDLENWNNIEEVIFYFPKTGKFIAPAAADLRYPYIPPHLAGAKGLFLKTTSIGSFRSAMPAFNLVTMEPYEEHAINMEAVVRFNTGLDTLLIGSKQILKGYGAASYRPIYTFLPKDKQDEMNRTIIKAVANSTDITNIHVDNPGLKDYFTNKPLVIGGDIRSTELLEKAGNKILVKLGEIIGQQAEMYQEKPRQLPVELDYPHILERKIRFDIPQGYRIRNLDDLKFDISYKKGDQVSMGFISNYVQEGQTVHVTISEIYRDLRYPLSEFEHFKKVINAAADFNKVVLVLEKQ